MIWLCVSEARSFFCSGDRQEKIFTVVAPAQTGGMHKGGKGSQTTHKAQALFEHRVDKFLEHPIKANPAKAGDAKPWVYRHKRDQDRQAAEDKTSFYRMAFNLQVLYH